MFTKGQTAYSIALLSYKDDETAKERNNVKMLSSLLKQNGVTSYQVIDDADASRRLIK